MANYMSAFVAGLRTAPWLVFGWLVVMGVILVVLIWLELRIRQLERGQDE